MVQRHTTSIIYVGNFVSKHLGAQPSCETLADKLDAEGFEVIRLSAAKAKSRRMTQMVTGVLRRGERGQIVLIDVFSTKAFVWAEMCTYAAVVKSLKPVLILRGGELVSRSRHSPVRLRALFKNAARVVTPSHYLQKNLEIFAPRPILCIPNSIDLSRYDYRLRRTPRPSFIWLRALGRGYEPEVAVMAFSKLATTYSDARLMIAGPDKGDGTKAMLGRVINDLGMDGRVSVVGNIPKSDVPAFLARGDVFLNTTTAESFGVSVMEAAACGMCIVTTDVGELSYIWKHESNALLVPPSDPDAMASALRRVLEEPGLAEVLSRNARRTARGYDWPAVMPRWRRLLAGLSADE